MEERNSLKINISTILLILSIILIIIMVYFIYKLYIDKQYETEKIDYLNSQISNLQNQINTLSPSDKTEQASNEEVDKELTKTEFTDDEIKHVLQMCLDLESAKTNGPQSALYTLGLYIEGNSYFDSEKSAEKYGFIKTSIKYTDFKQEMLKYMTEKFYKKEWDKFFINENGYLCYNNVGATGVGYKVNTIEKVEDGYIANVNTYSEGIDIKITVNVKLDNNKCIIDSLEFSNT